MKRFTDTEKWRDPWFRRLKPEHKLAWDYIWASCDNSGVWVVDWDLFTYLSGVEVTEESVLTAFVGRVVSIGKGRWWIPEFIAFQFGELVEQSRVHQSVIRLLNQHGIHTLWIDYKIEYQRGSDTPKDKDKDKDKDSCLGKGFGGNPSLAPAPKRLHGIPWTVEEVIAYGKTVLPPDGPVTAERCREFFAHYEGQIRTSPNGDLFWITSGDAVVTNWKIKLPSFKGSFGGKGNGTNQQNRQPSVSASRGTANEGRAASYANAKAIKRPVAGDAKAVPDVPGLGT